VLLGSQDAENTIQYFLHWCFVPVLLHASISGQPLLVTMSLKLGKYLHSLATNLIKKTPQIPVLLETCLFVCLLQA